MFIMGNVNGLIAHVSHGMAGMSAASLNESDVGNIGSKSGLMPGWSDLAVRSCYRFRGILCPQRAGKTISSRNPKPLVLR